ncbi:MAG: DUF58 domain-containing protein [Lachnospiraceae bacterium]|nr:DUF58 domain-containing protein [Lachnospiraceae bacterium]
MHIKRAFIVMRNVLFLIAVFLIFILIMLLFEDYSVQLPIRIISVVMFLEVVFFIIFIGFVQVSVLKHSNDIVSVGDKIKLSVFVNKRGVYPFKKLQVILWYKNNYDDRTIKKKIQIELNDKIRQAHDIEIEADKCGYISVGIENSLIYDMFAFLHFKCKLKNSQSMVMVLPKVVPVETDKNRFNRISIDEEEAFRGDVAREGLMDRYEVREFIPGDSLNRIHWKLTAKNDDFMVKDFKDSLNIRTYVYFDLRKGSNINKMFEESISMAYSLIEKKIVFYAMWIEYDNILSRYALKRKMIKDETEILEALSIIMNVKLYDDVIQVSDLLGQIMNSDGSINSTFTI